MFSSYLSSEMSDFLEYRKASVGKSCIKHDISMLHSLDAYLSRHDYKQGAITEGQIIGWISSLNGKTRTIAEGVIKLRIFLIYLSSHGYNVYIPIIPKVHDDYMPYIYTDEQLSSMIAAADACKVWKSDKYPNLNFEAPVILRLLYGCGLRAGETLNLRMRDIDLDKGFILLHRTKGNKERIVPMHSSLTDILESYCMAMGIMSETDSYLFPSAEKETPVTVKAFYHYFRSILKRISIDQPDRKGHERGPCVHCLRHAFALRSFSQLEANGIKINDAVPYLSIYLGHSTLTETEKYLKFSNELFPDAMEKFDSFTSDIWPEVDYGE